MPRALNATTDRLLQMDALRGLALLGVLLVNLDVFNGTYWLQQVGKPIPMGWGGEAMDWVRRVFLEDKAIALLSMLFGAGLAIQKERAFEAGRSFAALVLRRCAALAAFGVAHSFLLWNGDVLLDYAVISLMVWPFLGWRTSRVLWAIPILVGVSILLTLPFLGSLQEIGNSFEVVYRTELRHYGQGGWMEALRFRAWEMLHWMGPMRVAGRLMYCAPFFLLGVYLWKKGILQEPSQHVRTLKRLALWALLLGLLGNVLPFSWLRTQIPWLKVLLVPVKVALLLAKPCLFLGYTAGVLLLVQKAPWAKVLGLFAPLGRMALSQYLLQSVVCTLVFIGYGLGLFGKVPLNLCMVGGLAFYALQVWSSRWWLSRFAMGPMESLWRMATYGVRRRTA